MKDTAKLHKKTKKPAYIVNVILSVVALAAIIYAVLTACFNVNPGLRYYAVATSSMDPVIPRGSLVFTAAGDFYDLERGDIITVRADVDLDGKKEVVTHYFADYIIKDGATFITTYSEAAKLTDSWYVEKGDFIGKCVYVIPKIGMLSLFFSHPIGAINLAVDALILLSALYLMNYIDASETRGIRCPV